MTDMRDMLREQAGATARADNMRELVDQWHRAALASAEVDQQLRDATDRACARMYPEPEVEAEVRDAERLVIEVHDRRRWCEEALEMAVRSLPRWPGSRGP